MRKPRIGTTRRHVYPYECEGCGKRRVAYDHERAKRKECRTCERDVPNPNQAALL